MSWVSDSYCARFGNFPPVLYWRGTVKGLQALMMQALERGTPLTADELMKVQGHSEPSPKAKTIDATSARDKLKVMKNFGTVRGLPGTG